MGSNLTSLPHLTLRRLAPERWVGGGCECVCVRGRLSTHPPTPPPPGSFDITTLAWAGTPTARETLRRRAGPRAQLRGHRRSGARVSPGGEASLSGGSAHRARPATSAPSNQRGAGASPWPPSARLRVPNSPLPFGGRRGVQCLLPCSDLASVPAPPPGFGAAPPGLAGWSAREVLCQT